MIAQYIQWCVTVIQNAAIRARQRNRRFNRDILIGTSPETSSLYKTDSVYNDIELILLLKSLPKIESQVLYCTLMLNLTQKEISEYFNISQQQVSRIKGKALNLLREEAV
ncbi:sigma factor-like helix-turn-helix DNA-binding protein [Desulfosporosinus meridiei]|uniref:sigma factor-like helix-turn-helix DNA-binding protein n=1 Tax=Desulfosporosinus meridiei TaxID=79209 RepID=UPI000231310A|nr:sigma factor-like helix-turn-helix DNA-binding protein [Desulfosporosinus meridiei]